MTKTNTKRIEELVKELLLQIGEDPSREGIVRTPERVAKAWDFFPRAIPRIWMQLLTMQFLLRTMMRWLPLKMLIFSVFVSIICFLFSEKLMWHISPMAR